MIVYKPLINPNTLLDKVQNWHLLNLCCRLKLLFWMGYHALVLGRFWLWLLKPYKWCTFPFVIICLYLLMDIMRVMYPRLIVELNSRNGRWRLKIGFCFWDYLWGCQWMCQHTIVRHTLSKISINWLWALNHTHRFEVQSAYPSHKGSLQIFLHTLFHFVSFIKSR